MSICDTMKTLKPQDWENIQKVINYHGDPSVLSWILEEIRNNKSWHLIYDFFENDDDRWYLLPNDKSWTIACDKSKDALIELATQYGKEVEID